jgi:hypothetical protein
VSILKQVGQINNINCLLGHQNDFVQSNTSRSTQDMRTSPYGVTLFEATIRRLNIVWIRESPYLVYTQKGNSTELGIYHTVSNVTWRTIIFRRKK